MGNSQPTFDPSPPIHSIGGQPLTELRFRRSRRAGRGFAWHYRDDPLTRVANQLRQSLTQVSSAGSTIYRRRQAVVFEVMTDGITRSIADGDIAADVDVNGLARTVWAASLGNRVLADALGDDAVAQLAQIWQVLLRGIVPAQSFPYFRALVARMATQYQDHTNALGES